MGKGIIVRVPNGFELPSGLRHFLDERFPDHTIDLYDARPDHYRSFVRRIDSLYHAFSFLLDAYPFSAKNVPLSSKALKAYAEECKMHSMSVNGPIEELHQELELFTAKLIDVIRLAWKCPRVKEAVELLNEAEQYQLMQRGRFDLATLVPMKLGQEVGYVLQLDESLPPHEERFIGELAQLKHKKYPKTPSWFRKLDEFKQVYFCNLDPAIVDVAQLAQDYDQFLQQWELIKKNALNIVVNLQQIAKDALPLPQWFNNLSPSYQEMIRVLAAEPNNLKEKERKLKELKHFISSADFKKKCDGILDQFSSIPQWYWVLPEQQQFFLEHVLQQADRLEDAVSFLPSRLRTLPLPANFAAHSIFFIHGDGEVRELYGRRYRSSHIASRDALNWPKSVQQRHSDANLAKVMEHAKAGQLPLLQTLISPIYAADYVPNIISDFLPTLPPDLDLYKLARASVERRKKVQFIQQNNHPYNAAKRLYFTQVNDEDSLSLLAVTKKYVSATPGLKTLLDQYKNVLDSPMGSATFWDYAGRELFLSSLEQLIILTIGGHSYGSCVSGKDRKAIELIHTDAMITYKELYGAWPIFDELQDKENRIRFVALVADLYMSWHQHEHAGQNAPGSEGIKTPDWYLPKDIVVEINQRLNNERALKDDDRVATDNEVKNIFIGGTKKLKSYFLPEKKLLCQLVARQLGEENCTKIYDALHSLINEKSLFVAAEDAAGRWTAGFFAEGNSDYPEGIKLIRDLMLDPLSGRNNVLRVEKILQIVSERPEVGARRTRATNAVYDRLRSFLNPLETDNLNEVVEKIIEEWTSLFNAAKGLPSDDLETYELVAQC